jgi:hypothetical protein
MRAALPQNQNLSDMKKKIYRPYPSWMQTQKFLAKF